MRKYYSNCPNKKKIKIKRTHREKVEGCRGFPGRGVKYSHTANLAGRLTEAPAVEKFQGGKEEVLLDVLDGSLGVVTGGPKLMT